MSEDPDGNGDPTDDDTDGDGTPDYLDPDDDGDGLSTIVECPGGPVCPDEDGDGTPDYLDPDPDVDGDGVPTAEEDRNGDGDPTNDDSDGDGVPDYLDGDDDGDGVREAHGIPGIVDGTPFQVTYQTTDDPLRMQTAQSVQAHLAECGIQISVETAAPDVFFAREADGPLFGRRFDLAQFSWRATSDPLCDLFLSGQMPDVGRLDRPNVAGFLDDEYDTACLSALEAWPGGDEYTTGQAAAYAEAQRIFTERLPVLPLFQHSKVTFAHASIIGLAPNPTQVSELWNIEQIGLRP